MNERKRMGFKIILNHWRNKNLSKCGYLYGKFYLNLKKNLWKQLELPTVDP